MASLLDRVKQKIVNTINPHKDLIENFNNGYNTFLSTGKTPEETYMTLINLYCATDGKFNDKMNHQIISKNPPKKITEPISGVIGTLSQDDFKKTNDKLNKDGYAYFDKKLPSETIAKLREYALKTGTRTAPKYDAKVVYDPNNPTSEIYRFDILDLINNKEIQDLIMDPAFINVARNYLGCEPIFDFPAMWWSTSYLKEASSEAAQLYHFDLDRIKWLKIFIYLSDVTPENGPHSYIRGSHISGTKPKELLDRGYARIPDTDLTNYYKKEDFITVHADAGTVFAGDTKCWHKGTPLKKGDRLVLEFEYTSSMFGTNYPKLEIKNTTPSFKEFCKNNPIYAANFQFND